MVARKHIGILSLSAIPDDPRVRRQGDAFTYFGCTVTAVGLPGARSAAPSWKVIDVNAGSIGHSDRATATGDSSKPSFSELGVTEKAWVMARALTNMARTRDPLALYWSANPIFEQMYQAASRHPADVWIANDWTTLPIALRLWREKGIPYHYDTHEFATEEYAHRLSWRLTRLPLIRRIERAGVLNAESVSTVSEPIAQAMRQAYGLSETPWVIRNLPAYEYWPSRPPDGKTRVLYHGIVAPNRGLEAIIDSTAHWPENHTLTIRGPGDHSYINSLKERSQLTRSDQSIFIEDPVPMTNIIKYASNYDIGLALFPPNSYQNRFALPNKIFEYIMAGNAVICSDFPEMANIINKTNAGILYDNVNIESISKILLSIDQDTISRYRENARLASETLNWERERYKLEPICAPQSRSGDHQGCKI